MADTNTPSITDKANQQVAANKAAVAKIEAFYTPFHGRVGHNPYFYLHGKTFFDIKLKVDAGIQLNAEEQAKLNSIECKEEHAKIGKEQAIDLYRPLTTPALSKA